MYEKENKHFKANRGCGDLERETRSRTLSDSRFSRYSRCSSVKITVSTGNAYKIEFGRTIGKGIGGRGWGRAGRGGAAVAAKVPHHEVRYPSR